MAERPLIFAPSEKKKIFNSSVEPGLQLSQGSYVWGHGLRHFSVRLLLQLLSLFLPRQHIHLGSHFFLSP